MEVLLNISLKKCRRIAVIQFSATMITGSPSCGKYHYKGMTKGNFKLYPKCTEMQQ